MPWSQFTKGAFQGSSRVVFGRPTWDPEEPRPSAVPFVTPRGPRVTFNSNLKVTRPRREIYIGSRPAWSLWSPDSACRGPRRSPAGALTMLERVPVRSLAKSPGRYSHPLVTEIRIYQCSINQSINKSTTQSKKR